MLYNVRLPISGIIDVTVEAASESEAIEAALMSELDIEDVTEWSTHRQIIQGNVFHGALNEAEAELEE